MSLGRETSLRLGLVDLYAAMERSGCPACGSVRAREERYFTYLVTQYASDAAARDELLAAGGFCPRHTWLMTEVERRSGADPPVGSALLLDAILGERLRRIERGGRAPACPACRTVELGTAGELRELADAIGDADERVQERFEHGDGLCLGHLERFLALAPDARTRERVVAVTRRSLERVRAELRELDRKRQWSARDEPRGREQTSWRRAALLLGASRDEGTGQR